jgi:hypothetical protein
VQFFSVEGQEPDYTYEELLAMIPNMVKEKKKKFFLQPVVHIKGRKTCFANFADVCQE